MKIDEFKIGMTVYDNTRDRNRDGVPIAPRKFEVIGFAVLIIDNVQAPRVVCKLADDRCAIVDGIGEYKMLLPNPSVLSLTPGW